METNSPEQNPLDKLLSWIDPDREEAAKMLLGIRRKLVFEFRLFPDAEDLAGEVIDRALDRIKKGNVVFIGNNAEGYLRGVARFLKLEMAKARKFESLDRDEVRELPFVDKSREKLEEERLEAKRLIYFNKALEKLSEEERNILILYSGRESDGELNLKEKRENLSKQLNMTNGTLRVRISRIRKKLKDYLRDEGYYDLV